MKNHSLFLAAAAAALLSPLAMSAEEAAKKAGDEKPQKVEKVECEAVTGSRIKTAKPAKDTTKDAGKEDAGKEKDKDSADKCVATSSSPMRTYTKDQIEMTGETDLNEALRKLDPTFR